MTASRATAIIAGVVLVLAAAVSLGRKSAAPPPPAVQHLEQQHADSATSTRAQLEQLQQRGPVETDTRTTTKKPNGTVITREVLRKEAPVQTVRVQDIDVAKVDHAEAQSWSEQRPIPASPAPAPPRWSLSLSVDDALVLTHGFTAAAPYVRVAGGMRLVGPVWLEASIAPFRGPELGAGISLRW